ncbi:MAG: endonuclease [Frankiales bacterium]|nr:endonuclease [Frankiales bacterium]
MTVMTALTDEQLADEIVTWSARVAAGEARLLALVAEFDRREAWGGPGLLSCAHWLSWRVGLSPGAAREKVRVARRLDELPVVRAALAAGRLSYSQARAITRAATPRDEQQWVEMAAHSTAGQLERLARGVRRVRRTEEAERDPEAAAYRLRATKRYDEDGTAVYTVRLPAEEAALLDGALEQVRSDLDRAAAAEESGVSAETPLDRPPAARSTLAQALLSMAATVLERGQQGRPPSRAAAAALTVQVDPLSGWGRLRDGEVLPPTSLAAVRRMLPRYGPGPLRPLTADDLRRHDSGRTRRRPGPALRDLIGTLDGERCRFPGCTRHRRLHAHHVVAWGEGGPTDLDNVVLLCPRHHTLVHAQGFALTLHPDRRLEVHTAGGTPVMHLPGLPWAPADELDPGHDVSAETLRPPLADQRLDLGYAVMVLVQQAA